MSVGNLGKPKKWFRFVYRIAPNGAREKAVRCAYSEAQAKRFIHRELNERYRRRVYVEWIETILVQASQPATPNMQHTTTPAAEQPQPSPSEQFDLFRPSRARALSE